MVVPRRLVGVAVALLVAPAWAAVDGGEPEPFSSKANKQCRATMADAGQSVDEDTACDELRVVLIDRYGVDAHRAAKGLEAKVDLAPKPDLGRAGVESLQPSPAAGATAALAGTESGARVVTEIRLNPLALLTLGGSDEARARAARAFDLVALLPISPDKGFGALDYFGLRLRYNALGSSAAGKLLEKTASIFSEKSTYEDQTLDVLLDSILRKHATDARCLDALLKGDATQQEKECREAVSDDIRQKLVDLNTRLIASIDALREELDRRYLGVHLQADFGDPQMSGNRAARYTTVVGSVAGGQSASDDAKTRFVQIRLRAGLAYSYGQLTKETNYSFDWGAGVDVSTKLDSKTLRFGLGLEGRHGGTPAAGETNFVDIHLSVGVPLTDGSSLAVTASFPLVQPPGGGRKPMLNVSGNWELLVPVLKGL